MTFTLNGIGTSLEGERWLTAEEYIALSKHKDFEKIVIGLRNTPELGIETEKDILRFKIATKSFSILFPIIPLETFIYYYPKTKWYENDNKYIPLFYTKGKGKVDWQHVKNSWSFYVFPLIIIGFIGWGLFNLLFK